MAGVGPSSGLSACPRVKKLSPRLRGTESVPTNDRLPAPGLRLQPIDFESVEGDRAVAVRLPGSRGLDDHADAPVGKTLQHRVRGESRVETHRVDERTPFVIARPNRDIVSVEALFTERTREEQAISALARAPC